MSVMLHVEQECEVELLNKNHFMVEKSAPQTELLSVTQNHVLLRDLLLILLNANGANGVPVVPFVDQAWRSTKTGAYSFNKTLKFFTFMIILSKSKNSSVIHSKVT